jgi:hypothetical protein
MHPPETRQAILDRLAEGESLRAVCASEGMPGKSTVMEWLDADADFRTKYARAREAQADVLFEGMADIEDKVMCGELKPDAARVVLDSQRWRAEKLKPKAYGAKLDLNHSGSVKFERIECVVVDPAG